MRLMVGSFVEAVWAGDGQYSDAVITANNGDGTVTVAWADGETRFTTVQLGQLRITQVVEEAPVTGITVGDEVEAAWAGNGEYYNATIAEVNDDGSVTVNWTDGEGSHRVVSVEQVRAAPKVAVAEEGAADQFVVELDKTQGGKIGMDFVEYFANLVVEGVEPGGLLDCWNLAHPGWAVQVCDHVTQVNGVVGNSAALIDELCCNTVLRMIVQRGDSTVLPPQDAAPAVKVEDKRNDVRVSRMTTRGGEDIVTVTDNVTGEEVGSFDKQAIKFELKCTDTQQLADWLGELEDKLLPGLLMLLAGEVTHVTTQLKDLEKEQESLRGVEDYQYFGLDAQTASDKDVAKAYKKASMKLHPDKGGDPEEFDEMRKKFETLQSIRDEGSGKTKQGDGTINWDPNSRDSMMEAHTSLREQLIWISHKCDNLTEEINKLKIRAQVRLAVDVKPHDDSAASAAAQPVPSMAPAAAQPR